MIRSARGLAPLSVFSRTLWRRHTLAPKRESWLCSINLPRWHLYQCQLCTMSFCILRLHFWVHDNHFTFVDIAPFVGIAHHRIRDHDCDLCDCNCCAACTPERSLPSYHDGRSGVSDYSNHMQKHSIFMQTGVNWSMEVIIGQGPVCWSGSVEDQQRLRAWAPRSLHRLALATDSPLQPSHLWAYAEPWPPRLIASIQCLLPSPNASFLNPMNESSWRRTVLYWGPLTRSRVPLMAAHATWSPGVVYPLLLYSLPSPTKAAQGTAGAQYASHRRTMAGQLANVRIGRLITPVDTTQIILARGIRIGLQLPELAPECKSSLLSLLEIRYACVASRILTQFGF